MADDRNHTRISEKWNIVTLHRSGQLANRSNVNTILMFILFGAHTVCNDSGVEASAYYRMQETCKGKRSRYKTLKGKAK